MPFRTDVKSHWFEEKTQFTTFRNMIQSWFSLQEIKTQLSSFYKHKQNSTIQMFQTDPINLEFQKTHVKKTGKSQSPGNHEVSFHSGSVLLLHCSRVGVPFLFFVRFNRGFKDKRDFPKWRDLIKTFQSPLKCFLKARKRPFECLWKAFKGLLKGFSKSFNGPLKRLLKGPSKAFNGLLKACKRPFKGLWKAIRDLWKTFKEALEAFLRPFKGL